MLALGRTELMEQSQRHTEEVALVCGLVRPGALQLGGAVGADDDQRHQGMAGLQDGRMEVGHCRSRGREDRHWLAGELGQTQGQKSSGAFVHPDMEPEPAAAVRLLQGVGKSS